MNYNLDILEPTKTNNSPLKINEEQLQGLLKNFCYVKTNNEIMINYEINAECPYGDGKSWEKIRNIIL